MFLYLTSSSLPPQISSSSGFSSSTSSSSIRALKRSSRVCSISLRRFALRKSSVSSGVKKNVSSVSEGRSDQPEGESGWTVDSPGFGRVSSSRRASYLKRKTTDVSLWVTNLWERREIDFAVIGQIWIYRFTICNTHKTQETSRTNGSGGS